MNRLRTQAKIPVSRRTFLASLCAGVAGMGVRQAFPQAAGTPGVSGIPGAPALFQAIDPSRSGITWTHSNGRSPSYYLPETTGAGCAFLDYDNDGWMDIYLVNSGACDFFTPATPLRNALYRNNRDGTFTDVTLKAGVAGAGYGMGVAVGDFNGDGYPDMFVTGYNRSILYRNNGDGTFTDITEKSGIVTPGWASSAVWFDYDNDGRLDLFVCRFVEFAKQDNKFCGNEKTGDRYYCIPSVYPPAASWLFHNNGDGTFTDVSAQTGIASVKGKAWGAVATDVNNDGWMDLFVANDTERNFLFINHQGKFKDEGLEAGIAYSADGRARSGMGVDSADLDQDGWQDLFVTNVDQEMYSVYHNNHDVTFDDLAAPSGLGNTTRAMSGWGLRFFDYDNDGNLDLFIANGHPDDQIEAHSASVTYREPLLLFHNNGNGLQNVSDSAGPIFHEHFSARGLAIGDFDNDGAVDVLVAVNNGAPLLLRNQAAHGSHWLGLRLIGTKANIDAIGARIAWTAGTLKRTALKTGGGSFLASHDPRIVLGLGSNSKLDHLEIRWPQPSTRVDTFTDLPVDRYITIVEGKGIRS
ncbi:CRTAC1 family protein [Acidicapsa ligni]|uniref:CRTAC1 family protein n=1 Tax=Acidicapsa ligni TaxID=542300 RepID=UPI0021DFC92A|nr:CRTAC1 family protein [Acidicapsa ligni]